MLRSTTSVLTACASFALAIAPAFASDPVQKPKQLDQYVPASFAYIGFENIEAFGNECQKLALGRLMDAQSFERLAEELAVVLAGEGVEIKFDLRSALGSPELAGLIPNPDELVQILSGLRGSVALAIVDAKGFTYEDPSLAVGVDLGEMSARSEAWITAALQNFAEQGYIELKIERTADAVTWTFQDAEDPQPIMASIRDGFLFFSNDAALVRGFVAGGPEHSLATQPTYRAARSELDPQSGFFAWCDLAPVRAAMQREGEEAVLALRALGLDQMSWVGFAARPEGEAMRYRMRVAVEGGIAPMRRALGTKTSFASLEIAPPNTLAFMGMQIEPGGLLAAVGDMLQALPRRERPNLDEMVRELNNSLGINFERDVLEELGGELSVFAVPTAAKLPVPSFVMAVELREAASADRLVAHAERLLGEPFPVQQIGAGRLYRLPASLRSEDADFESFAVLGRWLLFAAPVPSARPTPALRRILNGAGDAQLGYQPSYRMATAKTSFAQHGGTLLYYIDWPALSERVYPALRAAVPALVESETLLELMPTMEALKAALIPAAGLVRVDERGLWFESCSVF